MDMSGVTFEQLDSLVRVTNVHSWVSLSALFGISAAAILFAIFYWVPKKVRGEGLLLIERDRLAQIRALGTGRLVKLEVGLGDVVVPDQVIGRISQEDLKDTIRETSERLTQLRDENLRLTDYEEKERTTQREAIARLKASIDRTIENSSRGLKVAEKIVDGSLRLRAISQLNDLDYLKDLQQKYAIQNDVNNGQSKLAELELTRLTSENQRQRAWLQRQLEIRKLETKLDLDQKKFVRTSQIVSHAHGTVTQILSAADEFVKEGAPVVLLSSPKATAPTMDDVDEPYEAIVFVPAGEGKKIDAANTVEVMPATIKREEYGFIKGEVVVVSELPATRLAMETTLQHPDLVDAFVKKYAPGVLLRVHVRLHSLDPTELARRMKNPRWNGNRYRWSTSSGSDQPLKTGTMCEAAIVVKQQRLISLVLPWLKKLVGTE
jgi:HlyD family secretion protein